MVLSTGSSGTRGARSDELARSELVTRLGARFTHRVTVLRGPAGIGKSTVIRQMRTDRDVVVACSALDRSAKRMLERVLTELGQAVTHNRSADQLVDRIAELALVRAPEHLCLVLDDAHHVTDAWVLVALLERLPRNAHLLLATRSALAVGIGRLDAGGELLEFGPDALRFDPGESAAFALDRGLGVDDVEHLDGWPALMALAGRDADRRMRRYVGEEIAGDLDQSARRALAALCLVGPLGDEEVEALLGWEADELLGDLPLVSVDRDGRWSLHDLWAGLLSGQLTDAEQDDVVSRAIRLHRDNGELERALELAVAHSRRSDFTELLRDACVDLRGQPQVAQLAQWLELAPPDARDDAPVLLARGLIERDADPSGRQCQELFVAAAAGFSEHGDTAAEVEALAHSGHVAYLRGDLEHLGRLVQRVRDLDGSGVAGLQAWLNLAEALRALLAGDNAAVLQWVRRVRGERLTDRWQGVRSFLEARALLALGEAHAASQVLGTIRSIAVPGSAALGIAAQWASGSPHEALGAVHHIGVEAAGPDPSRRTGADLGQRDRFLLACHRATMSAYAGDEAGARAALGSARDELGGRGSDIEEARFRHAAVIVRSVLGEAGEAELRDAAARTGDRHPGAEIVDHHLAWHVVHDPALADRRQARHLGPAHREALAVAGLLLAARRGDADALRRSWPHPAIVAAHLPYHAAAELAVAGLAAGSDHARDTAAWLCDHWGRPARVALLAACEREPTGDARTLLRGVPAPPARPVRITVLGPLELWLGDERSAHRDWQRSRVRELALLLVLRRRVRREAAADALWPALDAAAAAQNLRRTLAYLNAVLEPERTAGDAPWCVRSDSDSLEIHASTAVDLWEMEAALDRAHLAERDGDIGAMLGALDTVVELWRGPLADGSVHHDWALDESHRISATVSAAVARLADLRAASGDRIGALAAASAVLRHDPWNAAAGELVRTLGGELPEAGSVG